MTLLLVLCAGAALAFLLGCVLATAYALPRPKRFGFWVGK